MEPEKELERLKAKKMLELKMKLALQQEKEKAPEKVSKKTDREILVERLVDRGKEVLEIAESTYPRETAAIVRRLATLIRDGTIAGDIAGGELLYIFRALGLRIRVETRIDVEDHGKMISLQDRLKSMK